MKSWAYTIFFCLLTMSAYGQGSTAFVWEASTSVNYKLGRDWSFNTAIGKRSVWLNQGMIGESGLSGNLAFGEINQFATYKFSPMAKASVGYKFRWLDPSEGFQLFEHRVTQQIAILHRTEVIRLASRIRSEQRFINQNYIQRWRFRFSIDFPLSGETLDAKEFYFLASNEILYEMTTIYRNRWGNRLTSGLGYLFGDVTKVQMSFTFRSDNFTRDNQNRLFIETAAFINIRSKH